MGFTSTMKKLSGRSKQQSFKDVSPVTVHARTSPFEASDDGRCSSSASLHSTRSSKKLAWVLGPEAASLAPFLTTPHHARSCSPSPTRDSASFTSVVSQHYTHAVDETISSDESDYTDEDNDGDDDQDDLGSFVVQVETDRGYDRVMAPIHSEPALDSPHEDVFQFNAALQKVDDTSSTAPSSPDVDSLAIGQFSPMTSSGMSSPRYQGDFSSYPNDSVDFNEVCERLLDSFSSPLQRPSLEDLSLASSKTSSKAPTLFFTEPISPQQSSSASSMCSLDPEEEMEKTKNALVAERAALEAKLKLAAARDALKRVKSNVANPSMDGFAFTQHPRSSHALSERPSFHSRTLSADPIRPARYTLPSSHSTSSIDQLTDTSAPRSSRSSRSAHRNEDMIQPLKSHVRIGVAAPKDLSVLKKGAERQSVKAAPATKSKSKNTVYTPQIHITSINEVLA